MNKKVAFSLFLTIALNTLLAQSTQDCGELLMKYALKNDLPNATKLIEEGCDPNSKKELGMNMYHAALRLGVHHPNSDIATLLLENGADPNIDLGRSMTPFHFSAGGSTTETFKLLLEKGGNVNTHNPYSSYPTPLVWAISEDKFENMKLLIENGARINPEKINGFSNPLYQAFNREKFRIAKYLLEKGANPNTTISEDGGDCIMCPIKVSPIHRIGTYTVDSVAIKFIDLLVEHSADINKKNGLGQNVLTYMAPMGNSGIAEYLIQKGVSISDTAVVRAASYQNNQLLKVLLQSGGNPNATAYDGWTTLGSAISCCGDGFNDSGLDQRLATIELLLKMGAKPSPSLIDFVKKDEFKSVAELFQKYGF